MNWVGGKEDAGEMWGLKLSFPGEMIQGAGRLAM